MINLIHIFLYFYIANILFIVTSILTSKKIQATITEITLGQFTILKIGKLKIGLIPLAASINLANTVDNNLPQESFDTKTNLQKICLLFSPWVFNIMIGIIVLRGNFIEVFSSTYHQLFVGALHPFSYAQQQIGHFFELCQVLSWQIFAIFLIKMTAINLLPFAVSSIFQLLLMISNIKLNSKKYHYTFIIAIIPTITIMGAWSLAIIKYATDHI